MWRRTPTRRHSSPYRRTARVRALVGGRSYGDSQFDRATQALRPPGSSFKLFVYLAGMEGGMTPDDTLVDGPISVGNWRPNNYDDRYYGPVSLRDGLRPLPQQRRGADIRKDRAMRR